MPNRVNDDYQAIKALAMSYGFPPDQRIWLEPLAKQLNTNTHQVRDALLLLVGEGWVIKGENKGFLAKRPDAAIFTEYNIVNQCLIESALYVADATQPLNPELRSRFASIRDSLVSWKGGAKSLADVVADVFSAIIELGDNRIATTFVELCNEQLHFLRIHECQQLKGVPSEIATLCELALDRQFAELRIAIAAYQDRRTKLSSIPFGSTSTTTIADEKE